MLDQRTNSPSFKIGEVVVHPSYGPCCVWAIESSTRAEGSEPHYVFLMGPARNQARVLVPVAHAQAAGLRHLMTSAQATQVLATLQVPAKPVETPRRRSLEELSGELKHTDPIQIAAAIRDSVPGGVSRWGDDEWVPPIDQRHTKKALLGRALQRLVTELALVHGESRGQMQARVRQRLRMKP